MAEADSTAPVASGTDDRADWISGQRRLVQVGAVAATLGVVAAFAAFAMMPVLLGPRAKAWAVVTLVAAALMLGVCVLQVVVWRSDRAPTGGRLRLSWAVHLVSYAVTLLALVAGLSASAATGLGSVSTGLWAFTLLLVLVAQVTAGVQYRRAVGEPPGTVPAHVRRLRAWIKRSQEREDQELENPQGERG